MATNAIVAGGYDPAVLPEKSTSVKEGFTAVTVKLRDGTIEGLSGITRIGNVTVPETSEFFFSLFWKTWDKPRQSHLQVHSFGLKLSIGIFGCSGHH